MKDYLNIKLREFREIYDEPSNQYSESQQPETPEEIMEDVKKDIQAMKFNINNYCTPEEEKEYYKEREKLEKFYNEQRYLSESERMKLAQYKILKRHQIKTENDKINS